MINNLLDTMDESTNEIEDIFQEFILRKNQNNNSIIYCFFEGKDDYKYYGFRIKQYTDKEILPYECNGKDNLLMLHAMIKNQTKGFEDNNLLFFIDRDFDLKPILCKEIYITPGYAIENFYITDSTFEEFLKGELHISKYSRGTKKIDYDRVLDFYKEKRKSFIGQVTLLNIWYSLQKNKSREIIKSNRPDLSQIKTAYSKKLKGEITIEVLENLTPNYIEVSEVEIRNEKNKLTSNVLNNFRGKYFEEFLFKILNEIITDANKPNKLFTEKRNINLTLGKNNLISLLTQYADTPKCLNLYLRYMLEIKNEVESELEIN